MSPKRTTQSSVKPASKPSISHGMNKDSTRETNARASSAVRGLLSGTSALLDSGRSHFADAVVVGVADIDRAVGGGRGAVRPVERGGARRTAVAVTALPAAAGDRGDRSGAQ